nr:MAG TPA: hypothetical protein [Caudoviricetes sp.]
MTLIKYINTQKLKDRIFLKLVTADNEKYNLKYSYIFNSSNELKEFANKYNLNNFELIDAFDSLYSTNLFI